MNGIISLLCHLLQHIKQLNTKNFPLVFECCFERHRFNHKQNSEMDFRGVRCCSRVGVRDVCHRCRCDSLCVVRYVVLLLQLCYLAISSLRTVCTDFSCNRLQNSKTQPDYYMPVKLIINKRYSCYFHPLHVPLGVSAFAREIVHTVSNDVLYSYVWDRDACAVSWLSSCIHKYMTHCSVQCSTICVCYFVY